MLTTENYKFKKPELTDSPPDITVMNPNWDLVDEKLFAVIQAWENFKANGGEIGGNTNINGDIKLFGSERLSNSEGDTILSSSVPGKFVYIRPNGVNNPTGQIVVKNGIVEPNPNIDLGGELAPWKDIWVGQCSKNTNGYTKLPNGLILQWGNAVRTGEEARAFEIYPKYPIEFPNTCLAFVCTVGVEDAFTNTRACEYYAIQNGKGSYKIRAYATGEYAHTVERAYIQFFTIGY